MKDVRHSRILLVEDDASVRRAMQLMLTAEGYDVRSYASGRGLELDKEALEADCLVTDMVMPGVNALDLLSNLRGVGWPGAAILVTGFFTSELEKSAIDAGFSRAIPKPLREAALVREIAGLLSGQPRPSSEGG